MKSSKRAMKKALCVLLSAAITAGLRSATGIIAAAETLSSDSGKVAATASDAEKEDKKDDITVVEEPLDEKGCLLDGNISDDLFIDPDQV